MKAKYYQHVRSDVKCDLMAKPSKIGFCPCIGEEIVIGEHPDKVNGTRWVDKSQTLVIELCDHFVKYSSKHAETVSDMIKDGWSKCNT